MDHMLDAHLASKPQHLCDGKHREARSLDRYYDTDGVLEVAVIRVP